MDNDYKGAVAGIKRGVGEMKIAIYCRVSRGDLNPENQRLRLIEHCKLKGWDYEVFEEIESSRKTRPIKEKILSDIRKGKFDGILI